MFLLCLAGDALEAASHGLRQQLFRPRIRFFGTCHFYPKHDRLINVVVVVVLNCEVNSGAVCLREGFWNLVNSF